MTARTEPWGVVSIFGWNKDQWAYALGWYAVFHGKQPDETWGADDYLLVQRAWRERYIHEPDQGVLDQYRNRAGAEYLVNLVNDMIYGVYA